MLRSTGHHGNPKKHTKMKKKTVYGLMAFFAVAFMSVSLTSCSDDDDKSISELENKYFTIENGKYVESAIPSSTISESLEGIDMSDKVMNGAMNYISVVTKQKVSKFFVGIKGVYGYVEYVPENNFDSSSSNDLKSYVIPVMMSQEYSGNSTMVLSAELENGNITAQVENKLFYIETMPGAIEIKLSFSNSKDIDLHLYTPSGEHIYYNNRGGSFTDEAGNVISYGLDIDSNAGCHLDNVNKENIYIPMELVEAGEYTVVVNMYSNCQPSAATNWSIIARYQGNLVTPTVGSNPASGLYKVGAPAGDMTKVMSFRISEDAVSKVKNRQNVRKNWKFTPAPLTDADMIKLDHSKEI